MAVFFLRNLPMLVHASKVVAAGLASISIELYADADVNAITLKNNGYLLLRINCFSLSLSLSLSLSVELFQGAL